MKFKRLIIYTLIIVITLIPVSSFANDKYTLINDNYKILEVQEDKNQLHTYSKALTLIESNSGKELYSKNADQRMYPASTTKILTAILAIENGNLDDTTTVKYDAISVIPAGYSSAYLKVGEKMTIRQLLEVFLIHSANEAGNVLAEYVSGTIDEFVNLMNKKIQELGCKNTHFVNTNGIQNKNHYTTAQDLATIARYCMKNPTFRSIVSMKECNIPKTNKSDIRKYKNTNNLIDIKSKYYIKDCIGIKTGFTTEAGNCLISAFNKDGLELISVVLGAPTLKSGESTRCIDSNTLYNYGYSNYSIKKIASKNDIIYNINIKNGTSDTKNLDLILSNDISAFVNNSKSNLSYSIELKDNLYAPIAANSVVGTITYTSEGINYTENLLASHNVKKSNMSLYIIIGILILLILIIFIRLINKSRKKK